MMKGQRINYLLLVLLIFGVGLTFAQNSDNKWLVGIGFHGISYEAVNGSSVRRALPDFGGFNDTSWTFPISKIQVAYSISPSFALDANLSLGTSKYSRAIYGNDKGSYVDSKRGFAKFTIGGRYKFANGYLLKESSFFDPYIRLGVGYLYNGIYKDVYEKLDEIDKKAIKNFKTRDKFVIDVGVGINFWLKEGLGLNLGVDYNLLPSVKRGYDYGDFLQYSAGVIFRFGEDRDSDGDGVPNKTDLCPEEAGPVSLQGCPDRDGDGVRDSEDGCPDSSGPMENNGCPWPDTDSDGVLDKDDKCPSEKGPTKNNGCPWPDTDGDGVLDKDDECIDEVGVVGNKGCPIPIKEVIQEKIVKVNEGLKGLVFSTGSDRLTTRSAMSLAKWAEFIKTEFADLNVSFFVDGHTDSVGSASSNLRLSERRAAMVVKLLIDNGVDSSWLTSRGFGETNPIGDNSTPTGRAENRRVEITPKD